MNADELVAGLANLTTTSDDENVRDLAMAAVLLITAARPVLTETRAAVARLEAAGGEVALAAAVRGWIAQEDAIPEPPPPPPVEVTEGIDALIEEFGIEVVEAVVEERRTREPPPVDVPADPPVRGGRIP